MEKDHTMFSPDFQSKNKSLKPQMASDDQAVSTNINQAFFFVFLFLFFFFAPNNQQSKMNAIPTQFNKMNLKLETQKWSPLNLRILDQSLQVEWRVWQA